MSNIYASDPDGIEHKGPSFCSRLLKYTWKTISCLFSHITLVSMVVSYCILGALTFEKLERGNEIMVKKNISNIRNNAIDKLWNITYNGSRVLRDDDFIKNSTDILKIFEHELWIAITKQGWDGDENIEKVQWSLPGALFYSIIVITTIGYGHIAPRTPWGKVVTIFYAILGIPLMLLCLSNIGDIMATSFRFLYWKVCCYVCTKEPRRNKSRARTVRAGTVRVSMNRSLRSRTASFKRSARTSTRSADSGYEVSEIGPTSHSDTELRYHDEMPKLRTPQPQPSSHRGRLSDAAIPAAKPAPLSNKQNPRGGSLDRRRMAKTLDASLDPLVLAKTPVFCNRYVVEQTEMAVINHVTPNRHERHSDRTARRLPSPIETRRAASMPRTHYLEPPRIPSPTFTEVSVRSSRRKKRPQYNPSPTIMSPLGYGHRSKYLDDPESDDDFYDDYYEPSRSAIKPVPIWLCVFLVVSYIVAGTFLFTAWERWPYLDSAYFCFITLTTIGFGDLFPAGRVSDADSFQQNIAFCSLYLLFGIALLAMSFNLVQEEVIANVKKVAKTLGIIKQEEEDDEDDD